MTGFCIIPRTRSSISSTSELEFKGVKRRTKEELQNMMNTEKMAPNLLAGLIHIFNVSSSYFLLIMVKMKK